MQRISVYDTEAARVDELTDKFNLTEPELIEALFEILDNIAAETGDTAENVLRDYV